MTIYVVLRMDDTAVTIESQRLVPVSYAASKEEY